MGNKYLFLVFECENFIFDCVLEVVKDILDLKEKRISIFYIVIWPSFDDEHTIHVKKKQEIHEK